MKNFVMFVFVLAVSSVAYADNPTMNLTRLWDMTSVTMGESLHPLQAPQKLVQKQLQVPQMQFEKQAIQAPLKSEKLIRAEKANFCTLIPGRARRIARAEDRADRRAILLEARALQGRTLLETVRPSSDGATLQGGSACTSCNTGSGTGAPFVLTSLTTRELLEGGSIPQTRNTAIVQEPGVCGSNNCNGGGRRGRIRRR